LKFAKIVPIPKNNNVVSPNDFRPVSIQPVYLQIFEKCFHSQLSFYLESNNMLSDYQFGFQSTSHAIIALCDKIYPAIERNDFVILVSLDFKKAFDKVLRNILIHKLSWYNIDYRLIDAFLSDRGQFVQCEGNGIIVKSSTKYTQLGVPQGSCISCLFFSLMINDLASNVVNSSIFKFADDAKLVSVCNLSNISACMKLILMMMTH